MASRLGPDHKSFILDLESPEAIAETVGEIGVTMGIDILINNAGLGIVFPAGETNLDARDRTMRINLRAPWLMGAAALPFVKRSWRGRIINISSQAGVIAIEDHAAYGASKAGLINLTKVMAVEWARFGITSNAIAPTVVETPMALVGWSGEKGKRRKRTFPLAVSPNHRKLQQQRYTWHPRTPALSTAPFSWPTAGSASNRVERQKGERPNRPSRQDRQTAPL